MIPNATPIHAMANGVVVAGRLNANAPAHEPSFLLTRHEVYSQRLTARPSDTRLDYDHPPTVVWSLITLHERRRVSISDARIRQTRSG